MLTKYTTFDDNSTAPWKVWILRRFGFRCLGPYHSNKWHVFYPINRRNEQ